MRHIISDLRGNPVYTSFGSWRSRNGNSSRSHVAHHNPKSILFLYVKSFRWNSVIQRSKSHPQEILMFDDNGNTPLHIACQLDPPIEVLISLKDAVSQANSWGATPLHIAASHRCNAQALKKLIDFYPGALSRLSKMHRTPIHYACMSYRGLDLVAFQVLLEETIKESRRLEEMNQQKRNSTAEEHLDYDSKITDFIDILQETKDDIKGDNILDDEEISVLLDCDSQHTVGANSSDRISSMPSGNKAIILSNHLEKGENDTFGRNEDNYNVVTWKDTSGKTPLGLLFRRYRERVKRVIEILEQMKSSTTNSHRSSSSLQTDLGHLWGKARLIVVLLAEEFKQQHQQQQNLSSSVTEHTTTTQKYDDDSSASGQHWSQAASWSKERLSSKDMNKIKVDDMFGDKKTTHTDERQFRIVHASVGLTGYGCPPEMIRLAISIYPHQVREMDENGNLVRKNELKLTFQFMHLRIFRKNLTYTTRLPSFKPLHIAATASSLRKLTSTNSSIDEDSSVFSDSIISLFSTLSSKKSADGTCNHDSFDKVIRLLLKQYPQAAQTPHGRSGRLPLVLADRAGNRTWNDGMKTLLRAYPPALFSGSKGMIPVKLYPNVLSLIGGGNPPESLIKSSSTNTVSTLHRNCCNNGFKGRRGIGLLHNLMLLKQRHIKELMEGPSGESNLYGNSQLPTSKNNDGIGDQPERKKRKELATTMFELLRSKPDLIEASRSHQRNLKSDFGENTSYKKNKMFSSDSTRGCYPSNGSQDSETQRLSRGRKKTMSRKLIERMKVFERKTWKSI